MVSYKVVAPYVTLKVKDLTGGSVVQGFYAGGVVDALDEEQAKAQVALGLLEVYDAPAAEPEPEVAEEAPVLERPAGNASQEAWAKYAVDSEKATEAEVEGFTRDELRELYG